MASTFPPRLTAVTIDRADPEGNEPAWSSPPAEGRVSAGGRW
jgi:hypothetical protein